jgi:hypothetical protein
VSAVTEATDGSARNWSAVAAGSRTTTASMIAIRRPGRNPRAIS